MPAAGGSAGVALLAAMAISGVQVKRNMAIGTDSSVEEAAMTGMFSLRSVHKSQVFFKSPQLSSCVVVLIVLRYLLGMPQLLLEFAVLPQHNIATRAGACPANIVILIRLAAFSLIAHQPDLLSCDHAQTAEESSCDDSHQTHLSTILVIISLSATPGQDLQLDRAAMASSNPPWSSAHTELSRRVPVKLLLDGCCLLR